MPDSIQTSSNLYTICGYHLAPMLSSANIGRLDHTIKFHVSFRIDVLQALVSAPIWIRPVEMERDRRYLTGAQLHLGSRLPSACWDDARIGLGDSHGARRDNPQDFRMLFHASCRRTRKWSIQPSQLCSDGVALLRQTCVITLNR
jgi:hypothetical protein